jgi:hypothetical protein
MMMMIRFMSSTSLVLQPQCRSPGPAREAHLLRGKTRGASRNYPLPDAVRLRDWGGRHRDAIACLPPVTARSPRSTCAYSRSRREVLEVVITHVIAGPARTKCSSRREDRGLALR